MKPETLVPAGKETAGKIGGVVFEAGEIQRRVEALAWEISVDFEGKDLLAVAVLKGASVFASDLVRQLEIPVTLDFVSIARYEHSPDVKVVRITKDIAGDLSGRHVLLIEDIVDTGLSLHYLVQKLRRRNPASVAICTLLDRPVLRLAKIPMRYVGFEIDEQFLVGYGLDYQEAYRELPYIATLEF